MVSGGDSGFLFLGFPFGFISFTVAIETMGCTSETIGFACKAEQTPIIHFSFFIFHSRPCCARAGMKNEK